MKEKYFIRGLALNKELAFYYNECKKVDFSNNDDKNKNKYIYNYNKYRNKNKLYFQENKNCNKPKNIFKFKKNNGLIIKYSLKNIINNKLPLSIFIE